MTSDITLPTSLTDALLARLQAAPASPAPAPLKRPCHVVYGGAHLFSTGAPEKIGARAREAMEAWATDDVAFARTVGFAGEASFANVLARRVREKLATRPVEAICIDFEDGYGSRSDAEEDRDAIRAAAELAKLPRDGSPQIGVRIKALRDPTAQRALRTLDLFVTALARATTGALDPGFTVTIPKVTTEGEVAILVDVLEHLESRLGIGHRIGVELMIESHAALVSADGRIPTRALASAARGRAVAVHLGAYDLTAALGVTAGAQRLDHPYCDLARMLLCLSLGGTSIGISDSVTTTLPIAPKEGSLDDRRAAIHAAWAVHARNVRRAIETGIWQGWDIHPAQLPARYGALFGHFLEHREALTERLATFLARATQASRAGQAFDDAATGQALVTFFQRGVACGALDRTDLASTGLAPEELDRTFTEIADARVDAGERQPR